jgi:hypothetical protein
MQTGAIAAPSEFPSRIAVVVGNGAYKAAPLANPSNDARAVTGILRELGFRVELLEDVTLQQFEELVDILPHIYQHGSLATFYYAGHALQHRGRNYLLPVDFQLKSSSELPQTSLPLDKLLTRLADAEVRLALVVLDACRDNPYGSPDDALGPGLAVVEQAQVETLVAYATSAGAVALDGAAGNSPFTSALVNALSEPGLDIYQVFSRVRASVRQATDGRQLPWISGSTESSVVLREPSAAPPSALEPLPADSTLATVYWRTIEDSLDPADFEGFIAALGDSPLTELARKRLAALEASGEPRSPPLELRRDDDYDPLPRGLATLVTDCDVVASDDTDTLRLTPGVPWGVVNARAAVRVCARDLADDPSNPRLQFLMGRSLEVAGRFAEAVPFYEQAIASGYTSAFVNLGYMYRSERLGPSNYGRAFDLYLEAALRGQPRGRVNVGNLYLTGRGVPKSEREALRWTELAAETGWPFAINALGDMYRRGQGVPADPATARRLYEQAAGIGNGDAMNNLARLFEQGQGVERDTARAADWFRRAIESGNRYAPRWLGRLHLAGDGVPQDRSRARALFELAAQRGFAEAFLDLGKLHADGEGGQSDPVLAYSYLLLAQGANVSKATEELADLGERLTAEQREQAHQQALRLRREKF